MYISTCMCVSVCGRSSGRQNNRKCSKIKSICCRGCKSSDKNPHTVTKCAVLVCSPGYDGCPCVCAGRRNQKSLACCDSRPPSTLSAEYQKGSTITDEHRELFQLVTVSRTQESLRLERKYALLPFLSLCRYLSPHPLLIDSLICAPVHINIHQLDERTSCLVKNEYLVEITVGDLVAVLYGNGARGVARVVIGILVLKLQRWRGRGRSTFFFSWEIDVGIESYRKHTHTFSIWRTHLREKRASWILQNHRHVADASLFLRNMWIHKNPPLAILKERYLLSLPERWLHVTRPCPRCSSHALIKWMSR